MCMSYLFWTSIIDISLPKNKLNQCLHKTASRANGHYWQTFMYLFIFTDYMFATNKQYLKDKPLNYCIIRVGSSNSLVFTWNAKILLIAKQW